MQATPPLMPRPRQLALSGELLAPARLRGGADADPRLLRALERLNAQIGPSHRETLDVRFELGRPRPGAPVPGDDEGFTLDIAVDGVAVSANGTWGALHALTTLAQLADSAGRLPIGHIDDAPRYSWRGLMLDTVRHFLGARALYDVVDVMAFYRLNVLHLHLSDDQGFRMPSDAFPKLPSRKHYNRRQLGELVQRAADRGIRVVPELDMPGHVTSWLAAYPQWAPARPEGPSGGTGTGARDEAEAFPPIAASKRFGPHPAVLNVADEAVYRAIDDLFGELADIFPDPYVHIGGDEVLPGWWMESVAVRSYMERRGLADAVALQAHFNGRVAEIAGRHGKRLIGWDEVLKGGAPAGMTVQAWRGATARDRAMAAGHPCIESSGYYLDLFFPADVHHGWDPGAPLAERIAREDALTEDARFEHVAAGMEWTRSWREAAPQAAAGSRPGSKDADERAASGTNDSDSAAVPGLTGAGTVPGCALAGQVLGGEACLWSELVDERLLPVRLWSRMPVIAERLWSVEIPRGGIVERLEASLDRLAGTGLADVKRASRRLLGESGVADAQLDAVELLEPVKWYARLLGEQVLKARIEGNEIPTPRPYDVDTPLNRPVDALLPESFAAQRFARLLESGGEPLRDECKRLLAICRSENVLPELEAPLGNLAELLSTVVDVLEGSGERATACATAAAAATPSGEYIVAVAPAVAAWLERR